MKRSRTAITNVRVFDGIQEITASTVVIQDDKIVAVCSGVPEGAEIIDGRGCTLLPGLIDAHSHPGLDGLKLAMSFGVTTTCQMQGWWTEKQVMEIAERRDLADCLKSYMSICARGGHPSELLPASVIARQKEMAAKLGTNMMKEASTPDEGVERVRERVCQGADYIKVMIEDGKVFGHPNTPDLKDEVISAVCKESHAKGKLVVAHTMTVKASQRAIKGGVDGLMHLFVDEPHTDEVIDEIKRSGVFVCPTIVAGLSTIGDSDAKNFGKDERVRTRLSADWAETLNNQIASYPEGKKEDVLAAVKALYDAGVDILAGTDASQREIGGMVHGASLHHELQLLVQAGLTEEAALQSATSIPARRFRLKDRGRIAVGMRADMLLVKGNPIKNISDTLSIVGVWRQGVSS